MAESFCSCSKEEEEEDAFAETTFSLVVVLDRIEFLFLVVILFSKRHDGAFLMQEEDKRFEFVLVAKVLKLLLFTVVVAIVVIIVLILNVCVSRVYVFCASKVSLA